jgi:sec-independent protein translocase protein TatC
MTFAFTQYLAGLLDMTETYGASQYIGFMFNILIPLAVFFELPLVVLFLTKLGIISPQRLRKFRKYAYFFMFVIAAAITPSPDLASAVLVTIPMVALYELGVFLSGRAFRKKAANAADDGREPASAT